MWGNNDWRTDLLIIVKLEAAKFLIINSEIRAKDYHICIVGDDSHRTEAVITKYRKLWKLGGHHSATWCWWSLVSYWIAKINGSLLKIWNICAKCLARMLGQVLQQFNLLTESEYFWDLQNFEIHKYLEVWLSWSSIAYLCAKHDTVLITWYLYISGVD